MLTENWDSGSSVADQEAFTASIHHGQTLPLSTSSAKTHTGINLENFRNENRKEDMQDLLMG